jgi:hypothetical protein
MFSDLDDLVCRRSLLAGALGTGLAAVSASAGLAQTAPAAAAAVPRGRPPLPAGFSDNPDEPGFNPANPHHNFQVFARMRSRVDGAPTMGWFKGRVFAVVGDEEVVIPLFDLEGFGSNRLERQPDGTFRNFQRECGFYKDLATGEILDQWTNPMTGERCAVMHINNDPVNSRYAPTYRMGFGAAGQPPTEFPFLMPWTFSDEWAMASFDVNTRWPNVLTPEQWPRESAGRWNRVSEYLQFYVNAEEMRDWRNRPRIKEHGAWQRLGPWLPWMMMGGKPGHLFYRSHTRKLWGGAAELPADIRAYAEKNFPKYLEPPATWVEPNLTTFETYARTHKPSTGPGAATRVSYPPQV